MYNDRPKETAMKPERYTPSRRQVLQAAGISLVLPWLETFAQATGKGELVRSLLFVGRLRYRRTP